MDSTSGLIDVNQQNLDRTGSNHRPDHGSSHGSGHG